MSCGHHPLVTDEGASTEVVASIQGHLVRDGILRAGVAPDDLVIVVRGESHLSGSRGGEADSAGGWSPEPCGWTLLIRIPDRAQGGEEGHQGASLASLTEVVLPSHCVSAGHRARDPAGALAQTSTGGTRARTVNSLHGALSIVGSECGPLIHWCFSPFYSSHAYSPLRFQPQFVTMGWPHQGDVAAKPWLCCTSSSHSSHLSREPRHPLLRIKVVTVIGQ